MDNEKYQKILKNVAFESMFFLVLYVIAIIIGILGKMKFIPFTIICIIFNLALLIFTHKGVKEEELYGPTCGIISSIIGLFSFNWLAIIIAIIFLVENCKLYSYMNANSHQ